MFQGNRNDSIDRKVDEPVYALNWLTVNERMIDEHVNKKIGQ